MRKRVFALLVLVCTASAVLAQKPPVAPLRDVTDEYYGTKVVDAYRWMENVKDPEFQAWAKAQAEYTTAVLLSIPGRQKLLERIQQLDNAGEQVRDFQSYGQRFFYLKALPNQENYKLYMRDAK